jgi:hypothetical protein
MIQRYTRNTVEKYEKLRRMEKRMHKSKKRQFYEEHLKRIEGFNQLKESRKFYKLTNRLRKEYKPNILTCKKTEWRTNNK